LRTIDQSRKLLPLAAARRPGDLHMKSCACVERLNGMLKAKRAAFNNQSELVLDSASPASVKCSRAFEESTNVHVVWGR
jgi:hypothetical protein